MNIEQIKELVAGIAQPIAKQQHANSLVGVGTVLYLAQKGLIDLDDYLNYMNDLKNNLLESPDYDQDSKDCIQAEFEFYQSKLKK